MIVALALTCCLLDDGWTHLEGYGPTDVDVIPSLRGHRLYVWVRNKTKRSITTMTLSVQSRVLKDRHQHKFEPELKRGELRRIFWDVHGADGLKLEALNLKVSAINTVKVKPVNMKTEYYLDRFELLFPGYGAVMPVYAAIYAR